MGWNKQSGDAWVLQRTAHFEKGKHDKALQLQLLSPLLSIDDAEKLCGALAAEVHAARLSEGARRVGVPLQPWQEQLAGAVLKNWNHELGEEQWKRPPANLEDDDGCPNDD